MAVKNNKLKDNRDCDLTYALDSEGKLVNIGDVESGKKCGCFCPACKESLVARKGKIRKHHFAHSSGISCEHAYESMLHQLAKEKFKEAFDNNEEFIIQYEYKSYCNKKGVCKYIPLGDCSTKTIKTFNLKHYYDTCEQEKGYDNNNRRSDLKIYSTKNPSYKPIYLEFCVTHASDSEKLHSGNKIIEILIESEDDICNIIKNGIIETKNNDEEKINKISFYGFKNEDYKNENISSEIQIFRYVLYSSGKMYSKEDLSQCNNIKKKYLNSIWELVFHVPFYLHYHNISNVMKYVCYEKYKIPNCILCKYYKENNGYIGGMICICYKTLNIPYEETYKIDTARAKQCPLFKIDTYEKEWFLGKGLNGLVYDEL
ncbi:MAG: competence protein CoiA family protein [Bacteroidales bacterium]|nr:competence protein CoiA family protein [Bacteroidales bacterium]